MWPCTSVRATPYVSIYYTYYTVYIVVYIYIYPIIYVLFTCIHLYLFCIGVRKSVPSELAPVFFCSYIPPWNCPIAEFQ